MIRLIRRLLAVPILVWLIATLTFALLRAAPGSPFDRHRAPSSKEVEKALLAKYHMDEPLWRQYVRYMGDLLRGDLGPSLKYRNHSVNDVIRQSLPISMTLGLLGFGVALGVGIPAGFAAAAWRGGWSDWLNAFLVVAGVCIPAFVLGPFLILVFGLWLRWFPAGLWGAWEHAVLPMCALGVFFAARVSGLMKEGMLEAMSSPFIQAARAKGLNRFQTLLRHALRIALLPVLSYSGPMLADLLTGSFVVENVFQIPGTGAFFVNSFFNRDYPVMMGMTLVYSVLLLGLNLAVDFGYAWMDPRVRVR
jgi:oligopeptide transport system permease protein